MYELGAFLWNQEQANEALYFKHNFVKKVFTPDMEQIMIEFRHMYLITSRRDGAPSVLMPE